MTEEKKRDAIRFEAEEKSIDIMDHSSDHERGDIRKDKNDLSVSDMRAIFAQLDHSAEQDRETRQNTLSHIGVLQRFQHIFAKPLGSNERSNHDHSKRTFHVQIVGREIRKELSSFFFPKPSSVSKK